MHEVMFTSNENRGCLLFKIPISEDAHQKLIRLIEGRFPNVGRIQSGSLADTKLHLQSDTDRSVQEKVTFSSDEIKLIYECVGLRTEPSLVPVLVLPFPTHRLQVQ